MKKAKKLKSKSKRKQGKTPNKKRKVVKDEIEMHTVQVYEPNQRLALP